MLRRGANTIWTTRLLLIVAWMVAFFANGTVCADPQSAVFGKNTYFAINDQLRIDIQCSDLQAGNALCNFKTDMQYSKYLNTPLSAHDSYLLSDSEKRQRQADLLAIFRLAIEEFKFLSNAKLYWELTEQNLEELAIKLRLKGEIPLSDAAMHDRLTEKSQNGKLQSAHRSSRSTGSYRGALSLFMPSKIKWNLGMNPNDMSVFGELNLNRYLTLSGEYGDGHQVGVYFRYTF
jgi:hypothetical protein